MTYFKIIIKKKIINVGCTFLKWNEERKRMYISNVDEGQFVQAIDESGIYRDTWMKEAPKEAKSFTNAKVVIIDEAEFNDLLEELNEGNSIDEETPEIIPEHELTEEPEQEKPMSINDMRDLILQQQQQIELLLNKLSK
jgi:hypothetical protein